MSRLNDQRDIRWLRSELQPDRLLPGLTSGVLIGVKEVIFALSVGSLVFSGDLASHLPYAIGAALITQVVMLILISLGSSAPGVTGGLQDSPAVILAVIAAALVGALSAASVEDRLTTVLVSMAVTTLLTGLLFLALGLFKLGGLVRFIPYPVVGGFLAGTGWLLVQGSFGVMADHPLSLRNIPALLQPDQLLLWAPGVLLALVLLLGLRFVKHFLMMPGVLVGAFVLFYLALLVTGTTIDDAVARGLLRAGTSAEATWRLLPPDSLLAANWMAILNQGGNIAIILILSVVSLLLNASGIELVIRRDVDLNRELRVAGVANILSGLGGGMVGFQALDLSTLSSRIGATGRLPGLIAGILCGVMLFAGSPLLAFVPKLVLGGLLLFLGLSFLVEWVIDGWSRLSRADYAVVLLILAVIGATDFLMGVGVGLVAMIILFVLNYSRVNVVHHALTGSEIRSNVERCAYHRRRLAELREHVHVLELQGFIFFGTANTLLERIRSRLADNEQPQLRFIALDFRRVSGLDSSAVLSFAKCRQLAEAQNITLLLSSMSANVQRQLELGGLSESDQSIRTFSDLDHALEWCEDDLLEMAQVTMVDVPLTLRAQLVDAGFERPYAVRVTEFLEQVKIPEGEYLIRQDEEADSLYFIERGRVSVHLELADGTAARLHTLGVGTVVGELGLYLGTARTASVIADWPTTAYRLDQTALSRMEEEEPELAAAFHEFVARILSERLVAATRTLRAVLR